MNTIKDITTCPNPLLGIYNPPDELKYSEGYRIVPPMPVVADGYTRLSAVLVDDDGYSARWEVVDKLTSEIQAEQQAAKMLTFPAQSMVIFKATMERNFGVGACMNREIGADQVEAHFVGKQMAQTITAQELADAFVLERLFPELKEWNGTNETWSLFENYGGFLP